MERANKNRLSISIAIMIAICLLLCCSIHISDIVTDGKIGITQAQSKSYGITLKPKIVERKQEIHTTNPDGSYIPTYKNMVNSTFGVSVSNDNKISFTTPSANSCRYYYIGYSYSITLPAYAKITVTYKFNPRINRTANTSMGTLVRLCYLGSKLASSHTETEMTNIFKATSGAVGTLSAQSSTQANNNKWVSGEEMTYTVTYSNAANAASKTLTEHFGMVAMQRMGSSADTMSVEVACGGSATETVAPVPVNMEYVYDGSSHWRSDINPNYEAATWKDNVTVKNIKYTDNSGNETDLGTDKTNIINSGTYKVTLALTAMRWADGVVGDRTFNLVIKQKEPVITPVIDTYTLYKDDGPDKFPSISLPDGAPSGTIAWDSGQVASTTKEYNWTFTSSDNNYTDKHGSSTLTVTELDITAIEAEFTQSGTGIHVYRQG